MIFTVMIYLLLLGSLVRFRGLTVGLVKQEGAASVGGIVVVWQEGFPLGATVGTQLGQLDDGAIVGLSVGLSD